MRGSHNLIGKDDIHCVKCALMNVKVQSMIQEMKSLQLIIDILQEEMNWLKKEHKQDISSGNSDSANELKHKEEMHTLDNSKEWEKTKKNTHNMLRISKEPAPVITKTANYFEVLYNLNDNGTQKINCEVRSDTQSYTKNSNKKKSVAIYKRVVKSDSSHH
jgi:hypothetical protein